jgi:hypothetical protein
MWLIGGGGIGRVLQEDRMSEVANSGRRKARAAAAMVGLATALV